MKWTDLREEEFEAAVEKSKGVCVMPVGCMEKHGQHLPLGTDSLAAERMLLMANELEEFCIFPTFYFGDVQGYHTYDKDVHRIHGAIALSAPLMLRYMIELCDEIGRNGFTKVVLYNGHGGNTAFLTNLMRAVTHEARDYELLMYRKPTPKPNELLAELERAGRDAYPDITDDDVAEMQAYIDEKRYGGHACFSETAVMLGTCPELVRLDRADVESGISRRRCDHITQAGFTYPPSWFADYPDAYCGHSPSKCSKAIGDLSVKYGAQKTAEAIRLLKSTDTPEQINAWRKLKNKA